MLTTQSSLHTELSNLGIKQGNTVMVHASLRAIGPVDGRAEGLAHALLNAVGEEGNILAYVDFEPTPEVPYFDVQRSPARPDYGTFAEILRTWPTAVRSSNPGASMVAIRSNAEWLCSDHSLNYGYGPGSPLEKFVDLNGDVLLLGSDLDQVTLLHFAEHIAPLPNKRVVHRTCETIDYDGLVKPISIEEFDTSNPVLDVMPPLMFRQIVTDFLKTGLGKAGRVGKAQSHLLPAKPLVDFAVNWMVERYGA